MDETVLNELLECSVCLERLDANNKVLPCQHTFCTRCLQEIVCTKHELRCPECRYLVEVCIEDLPMNILLIRLLEGLKTAAAVGAPNGGASPGSPPGDSSNGLHTSPSHGPNRATGPKTGSASQQPSAKALYNYDAKEPGDLTFKKGDVVLLQKQVDENWYHGELNGQHGFFPATYVQVLTPLPHDAPKCKALYDFVIRDQDEKDCLTFQKDEVLSVIRRVDENWAEGKLGDRIGIFPISFVDMNESAKWLLHSQSSSTTSTVSTVSAAHSRVKSSADTSLPNTTPATATAGATTATATTSTSTITSALLANPGVIAAQRAGSQKRHSVTTVSSSQRASPLQSQANTHHRHSAEVTVATTLTTSVPIAMVTASTSMVQATGTVSSPRVTGGTTGEAPGTVVPAAIAGTPSPATVPLSLYVALYNYKPQKDDEIELKKGDCYTVTERCQDGWFKGTCKRTGTAGVFPGNYVQGIRAIPAAKLTSRHHNGASASGGAGSTQPSVPSPRRGHGNSTVTTSPASASSSTKPHSGAGAAAAAAAKPHSVSGVGTSLAMAAKPHSVSGVGTSLGYGSTPSAKPGTSSATGGKSGSGSLAAGGVGDVEGSGASAVASGKSHASVSRAHSFPKTSPLVSGVNPLSKHKTPVPLTQTKTITNVTQAQTRSAQVSHSQAIMSTQPQTVSQAQMARSQNAQLVAGSGSALPTSSRTSPSSTSSSHSHSPRTGRRSERERAHRQSPQCQEYSKLHHSTSSSARVTPPNVVVGATAAAVPSTSSGVVAPPGRENASNEAKEKKEKKKEDKLGNMMRRFNIPTKSKKSKPHSPDAAEAAAPQVHQRSGSLPSPSVQPATSSDASGDSAAVSMATGGAVIPPLPQHFHKKSASLDSAQVPGGPTRGASGSSRPGKTKPLIRERYRCISPYPPQNEAELELKVGDIVYVYRKRDDGWFKGSLQRTGKTGIFPSIFVERF